MVSCRGRAAVLACFVCVSLRGLLAQPVNASAEPSPETSAKHVHGPSHALSPGEAEFIRQRKEVVVLASLGRLNISSPADSVPHIALLGSGGGQRAAVALLGSLQQMGQDDLLDTLLYMGGVSGSTWAMALLYSDPQWSVNMEPVFSRLGGHRETTWLSLFTGPYQWLKTKSEDEDFSLSEIWGLLTSYLFMNNMDQRLLSAEASRGSTNPYPVYSAIEKQCFNTNTTEAVWFEFTPHEAGFPELGLFVSTAYLGSAFEGGELKERKPEMDMVQLQGIVGSALAHEDIIAEMVPSWMNMSTAGRPTAVEDHLRIYFTLNILVELLKSGIKDVTDLAKVEELQKRVSDMLLEEVPLHNLTTEEQVEELQRKNLALVASVQTWATEMNIGLQKNAVTELMEVVLPLLIKWQWGTTENFLYAVKDSEVPDCLKSRVLNLIDGGIAINMPYEPFLGKKRDVDLLIAPEFSAGEMFETLTLARDYAAAVGKPFPVIDEQVLLDKDWPKDFYVFPGENDQPTIIFMPLFNRINCKDEAEVKARMVEYTTFQKPFSPEKIAALQEIASVNMRNNKDAIVREIQNAATRRQGRRNVTDSAL